MYMNCAVVDIQPNKLSKSNSKSDSDDSDKKKSDYSHPKHDSDNDNRHRRDTIITNAKAQKALGSYPDLFVANLANINNCKTKETVDVVFGDPGSDVAYEDNESSKSKPSYKSGECKGQGSKDAGNSGSSDSSSSNSWNTAPSSDDHDDQSNAAASDSDGQWHPELHPESGKQQSSSGHEDMNMDNQQDQNDQQQQDYNGSDDSQESNLEPVDVDDQDQKPDGETKEELDDYLSSLYGNGNSKSRQEVPKMADAGHLRSTDTSGDESELDMDDQNLYYDDPDMAYIYAFYFHRRSSPRRQHKHARNGRSSITRREDISAAPPKDVSAKSQAPDASFYALLERLNTLGSTVFTLVKFAHTYMDKPPPADVVDGTSTAGTVESVPKPEVVETAPEAVVVDAIPKPATNAMPEPIVFDSIGKPVVDAVPEPIVANPVVADSAAPKAANSIPDVVVFDSLPPKLSKAGFRATIPSSVPVSAKVVSDKIDQLSQETKRAIMSSVRRRRNTGTSMSDAKLEALVEKLQVLENEVAQLVQHVTAKAHSKKMSKRATSNFDVEQTIELDRKVQPCDHSHKRSEDGIKKRVNEESSQGFFGSSVFETIGKTLTSMDNKLSQLVSIATDAAKSLVRGSSDDERKSRTVENLNVKPWTKAKRSASSALNQARQLVTPGITPGTGNPFAGMNFPFSDANNGDGSPDADVATKYWPNLANKDASDLPDTPQDPPMDWSKVYTDVDPGGKVDNLDDSSVAPADTAPADSSVAPAGPPSGNTQLQAGQPKPYVSQGTPSPDNDGQTEEADPSTPADDDSSTEVEPADAFAAESPDASTVQNAPNVGAASVQDKTVTKKPLAPILIVEPVTGLQPNSAEHGHVTGLLNGVLPKPLSTLSDDGSSTLSAQSVDAPDNGTEIVQPVADPSQSSTESSAPDVPEPAPAPEPTDAAPTVSEESAPSSSDEPTPEASEPPAASEPAPEEPAPAPPTPEEPAPEQPAPEEPAPETPAPEEPVQQASAPEGIAVGEPAPGQPAPAEPSSDEPTPEDQNTDTPAPEDQPAQDPPQDPSSQPQAADTPDASSADTDGGPASLGEALKKAFPDIAAKVDGANYQEQEQGQWRDDIKKRQSSPATSDSKFDITALLPYLLAPGPAAPPGVDEKDWPSQTKPASNLDNLPALENDLGPGSEEEVRKFFDDLKKEYGNEPRRVHARQFVVPKIPTAPSAPGFSFLPVGLPTLAPSLPPLTAPTAPALAVPPIVASAPLSPLLPVVPSVAPAKPSVSLPPVIPAVSAASVNPSLALSPALPSLPVALTKPSVPLSPALPSLPVTPTKPSVSVLSALPTLPVPSVAATKPSVPALPVLPSLPLTNLLPASTLVGLPTKFTLPVLPIIPALSTLLTFPTKPILPLPTSVLPSSKLASCLAKKTTLQQQTAAWEKQRAVPCGNPTAFANSLDHLFRAQYLSMVQDCQNRHLQLAKNIQDASAAYVKECAGV